MKKGQKFEVQKLSNGLVIASRNTDSENIFANLRINHGALHEQRGEEGTAHFLEHMIVQGGTEKYTPEEQARIKGNFGYENAFTSWHRTGIPWGMVASDFEKYLEMSSQMAFFPRLDETVLEQQKAVVLREISRAKGAPAFEDIHKWFRPTLARSRDHTYFTLGEESVIKELTPEKLRIFMARGYSPNNMILMLAGNIPNDFYTLAEKYFGHLPSGPGKSYEFSKVTPLEKKSIKYSSAPDLLNKDDENSSNSQISLGFVVPDEFHEDSASMSILSDVLGNSWTNGLKKRIRSEEGIAYSIGSSYSGSRNFGVFEVSGKVHAPRQEKALDIIFEEMNKLKQAPVNNEEIEGAKKRIMYDVANETDSSFNGMMPIDPTNISEIGRMEYFYDGRIPVPERLSQLGRVTTEDVQRVANLYLPSDRDSGKYVLLVRDPLKK